MITLTYVIGMIGLILAWGFSFTFTALFMGIIGECIYSLIRRLW